MSLTIGVCGFGRCGSTMLMRMLDAGGIPPVDGSQDRSYELPADAMMNLARLTTEQLDGRAVKLLDIVQREGIHCLPEADWRFIWLDRDHKQQARSIEKLLRGVGAAPSGQGFVRAMRGSMRRDRGQLLAALRSRGDVLVLRYEQVLAHPLPQARRIGVFVPGFRPAFAADVVHQRRPECAPDLTFELTGQPPGGWPPLPAWQQQRLARDLDAFGVGRLLDG